jgi:uncharacterized membrane protein YadS
MPATALAWISQLQVVALGAALFGMGCSVKLASLAKRSGRVMVASAAGTVFISGITLAGILLVSRT